MAALQEQFSGALADVAEMILGCQGHVLVAGAGTSRAIAQRFAHLLACCGTPGLFISAADAVHGGSGAVTGKGNGAKIITHTEKPDSALGKMADAVYHIVAPEDVDPYGMIATGSSLTNGAACDALCVVLLEMRGYTKEQFSRTHPGGAVGRKIEEGD